STVDELGACVIARDDLGKPGGISKAQEEINEWLVHLKNRIARAGAFLQPVVTMDLVHVDRVNLAAGRVDLQIVPVGLDAICLESREEQQARGRDGDQ